MKKKIFKNTIIIILLLVVLCGVSIIAVLYSYFNKQYVSSLNQAAGYIAEVFYEIYNSLLLCQFLHNEMQFLHFSVFSQILFMLK